MRSCKKNWQEPRSHDCRANHEGSSKMMESSVACELFTNSVKDGKVKYSTYVGDDDSTTLLHLSQNVPYGINKWSDQYHTKRSLGTRLYNLSQRKKFPGATPLSSKVINYLTKYYGGSESSDFRVACGVAQKNIGHSYVSKTLESINIQPGLHCESHEAPNQRQGRDKLQRFEPLMESLLNYDRS
ncbi:hypothetical protein QZH41_018732 [Actinostola sp. cb2023]|nr:hypothetical protein QZH41_018732 [Actinostola sp. cb2023]